MQLDNEKRNCENSAKNWVDSYKENIKSKLQLAEIEFRKLVFLNNFFEYYL